MKASTERRGQWRWFSLLWGLGMAGALGLAAIVRLLLSIV